MERDQAARIKEMEDEQQNFSQIMDCPYPTILPKTHMPLGQSSTQEQDLKRTFCGSNQGTGFRRPL